MAVMTAVDTWGRFTRADFEALPEDASDGIRYELLDGAIILTPSPGTRHQIAVTGLWRVLDDARPDGLRISGDRGVDGRVAVLRHRAAHDLLK